MRHIHTHVYRLFAGATGNQYLVIEPDGLTLVDTGLPGSQRLIVRAIKSLGCKAEDLRWILITHADPDHSGAISGLIRISPAQVGASMLEAKAIREGRMTRMLRTKTWEGRLFSFFLPLIRVSPGRVDRILKEGDELPILGGLRVIETSGHTPGHLSYYAEKERILFCGDSMKIRGKQLSAYQGDTTWDIAKARQAFEAQMRLTPQIICGGHGFYHR